MKETWNLKSKGQSTDKYTKKLKDQGKKLENKINSEMKIQNDQGQRDKTESTLRNIVDENEKKIMK